MIGRTIGAAHGGTDMATHTELEAGTFEPAPIELGLDTFGDVTVDADGRALTARAGDPRRRRRGRAGRPGRRRLLRRRRAPPRRLRRLRARDRAGRDRRPDRADPPRLGRHRAQLRRPGPGLPALRHAGRRLERPRRGHPRPRLVHRVVPAVRLRPRATTRRSSRRSSTCSSHLLARAAGHLGGQHCARRSTGRQVYPPTELGPARHLGRRRRQPGVGGPRRPLRPAR